MITFNVIIFRSQYFKAIYVIGWTIFSYRSNWYLMDKLCNLPFLIISYMICVLNTMFSDIIPLEYLMTYHRLCNQNNTTGVTSGAGTVYPTGASEFTPNFKWGSCCSIVSFYIEFSISLLVLVCFGHCVVCCL